MADEYSSRDQNFVPVISAVTDDGSTDIVQVRVDPTTKRLKVTSDAVEMDGHTVVGSGSLTIRAGGEVRQLSSQTCKRVWIQASENNSGVIFIGGSNVAATIQLRNGFGIYPTQGDWFQVSNLNLLYATSGTAGDAITFYYED